MMIDLARDFSPYPSGRVPKDGDYNGTTFREHILIPAIEDALAHHKDDGEIVIDIDGVRSFGSSFLEEAFGGLARSKLKDVEGAVKLIRIKCTKPHLKIYQDTIINIIREIATVDDNIIRIT